MNFTEKLQLVQHCYNEMELIISTCEDAGEGNLDPWSVFWDEF